MINSNKKIINVSDFDTVGIKLASPERMLDWSFGEVTKPETINYRTQRSEKNGLFDEKIFGPEKDYECYCGKYRGIRYKGIICEKCGVEITRSVVRRERMGHIELATPVSHIWFLKGVPSRMAMILDVSAFDLEKVIYFAGYMITSVNDEERAQILKDLDSEYKSKIKNLKDQKSKDSLKDIYINTKREIENIQKGKILNDTEYNKFSLKYGALFEAGTGAEVIYNVFKGLDLNNLQEKLEEQIEKAGALEKEKASKRLSLIKSLIKSKTRPEWMFLKRIPILPPALRPMVALDGGRHATSDVNDLYRRVINRNNRLKKLQEINAPAVILRNEKRILQEAVDALLDNSIRKRENSYMATSQSQRRPLKSLSDNLKSKQGLFRQNLLGKRVDYSGRSVIVVGPKLNLDQCGIPKHMALELFRPFVISKLLKNELAYNTRGANKLIDDGIPEVWAILEKIIADKYVLLNRAPTLHRLGIQAFRPILIEGNAIQVHPLVCTAFNADFDGDQMAVHIPLSREAQFEARSFMASNKNLLKPGNGRPVVSAKMLDIILGCFWMTKIINDKKGEGKIFSSPNEAISGYDYEMIDFRAKIKILPTINKKYEKFNGEIIETSVGRLIFNSVLPDDYPFVNEEINTGLMHKLIDDLMDRYEMDKVPPILDRIKTLGFKYATYAGITWGIDDIRVPEEKKTIVDEAKKKAGVVLSNFNDGLLSDDERYRKNIEIWHEAKNDVEKIISQSLDKNGPVYDMWKSGARGSLSQITAMAGMKGLIYNSKGETIDFPITTSSKEGHTPIEYFITTHGSRKGLTDTALNTAKAGYLTRKLFDVSQDVVITEQDCGTKESILIKGGESLSGIRVHISKNIVGRYISKDIINEKGDILFKTGHLLSTEDAMVIENSGIKKVYVRSPLGCKILRGICRKCYGIDLGTNKVIDIGETVGTIAAQAIGEPGTQLTMRTFHTGGTASVGGDITAGLPRVEEVFERRVPKNPAIISKTGGEVIEVVDTDKGKVIKVLPDIEDKKATKDITEYIVNFMRTPLVKKGDVVTKGQLLTDGSADLKEMFKYGGKELTQDYIIHEISKIYELQGASISRKHIEVIIRQMFSRVKIKSNGDTDFSDGDIVSVAELNEKNNIARQNKLIEAKAVPLIRGITEVALSRGGFLSAASFQHTTRILINSAVRGTEDKLLGLKENVIIGRLIPAGTGFKGSPKSDAMEKYISEFRNEEE
ncbi:DNA-directed RNA polymerase subunit beta' [Patescibacteria group bacterium]|nr:DNA-directed RNA polymerase subunit beta' [Patescibacteria group bacterium]MBU4115808.1 DNA-directed RNA polymerase subunit beta' [Patescibacteria group bacterium]